jgi:autotransporter-associated beta strand protein
MRANLGAAIVGASLMLATAAQAQSVWGGPASTTTTQNYKLGTNWDPNGAPVAAGQSAIFDTTGKSTINVNAGAIAPDSWTFNANSQSYTIGGAAVNFSATGGLFNNANAGQTISIDNNLGESAAGAQLQQLGNSTLILTGNNTYSGGTVIAAGTLQIGNGGTSGKISGDVLDLGVLAFNRSNNITFDGLILGSGQVNQIGTGTLILGGANTYSGGTLITNGGTLRANNSMPGVSSSVGAGTVTLDNGQFQAGAANLTFSNNFTINNSFSLGSAFDNNGKTLTLSGVIGDGTEDINGRFGGVTFVGSGKTILTGDNTYTGGTTICSCGTLQLGTAANSGSIVGVVNNEGVFNIVNSNTAGITTVTNQSGAFMTFHKSTDAGTMTIDNHVFASTTFNNAAAGSATINNIAGFGIGVVEFNKASTAASATINNAGFNYVVFNDQATLEGAKIVNKDAGQVFFNQQSGAGNIASSITNNDQGQVHFLNQSTARSTTITNNDFGVLDFNNHSSADNATIVNNSGSAIGLVFLNHSTAGNAFITTNAGSVTYFSDHSDGGAARFETASGGIVDFSGSSGLNNDGRINAGSIAGAGNYFIGAGNTLSVGGNDRSTEVSGVIADSCGCTPGAGALVKVGAGTLTLSGDNTYTGGTTITAGTLQLGNNTTMGSIIGDVVNNATLAFNRSNAYEFDGAISGSGAVQQNGANTTTLTAVNTYAGATTISAGTLALSGAGSIANSSGVINDSTFDISGAAAGASIKNLSGAGNVTLGNQTLTLTDASGAFAGVIGGNGGLVKQGAGLFTLTGANTYLGATTVADGNLRVDGSVASAVNVQSGATLSGAGSVAGLVTVQSGGTLSAGQSPGTLTLGALNLNAGSTSVFELGSPGVVGGPTNDLVNVLGNLTLGGALSVNAPSAGYYRLFNYGTLTPSSFASISGSSNGAPTVLTNVPNQVNLLIANAGQQIQFWDGADQIGNGVVNGGTGTWNAANTNWTGAPGQANFNDQWRSSVGVFAGAAGTVTIAGAQAFDTLQFSTTGYVLNAGAGGQLQLAGLSGAGTINTDNGVTATINAAIVNGSSQSLTKVGGGTLILTAANTYTGGTTISGGTLQLGNGGATGSIVGNVLNNGVFAINRSDAYTFAGVISGSGAFNQIGSGATTLSGVNTYTGATTVSNGTLTIASGASIKSTVTNNANFNNAGTVTGIVINNGTASNSGTISDMVNTGATTNTGTISFGLTNIAGTTTNTGTISGRGLVITGGSVINSGTIIGLADVRSGTLFTNTPTSVLGGLVNAGTVAASGVVNGEIRNSLNGIFSVEGALTSDTNFSNAKGAVLTVGAAGPAAYTLQGSLDNTGSVTVGSGSQLIAGFGVDNNGGGAITVAAGGTMKANLNHVGIGMNNVGIVTNNGAFIADIFDINDGTITNSATGTWTGNVRHNAGTITNSGTWAGNVASSTGTITNNLTWTGTVSNAGIFNNNAGATVSGLLTNTAGTTTNAGQLNGGAEIRGGTLITTGTIANGLTNNATVNANGGAINGAIVNSAAFNVGGTLTSDGNFINAANAALAIGVTGAYTLQGMLTNSGAVTVASGAQLIATIGGITNNAGGTIIVALGGTVKDDLNNAGAITNNGVYVANVASNIGTIDNNLTWTGTVSNAGAFNNNAGATVSGLLTNTAGTTVNNGALNGGASVSGGTFTGSGSVANLTVSGGIFAPGNGTPGSSMTVTGNLAFQSGAMYLVALNPTTASLAKVGGTAALNGSATAIYLAGNYVSKKYTILTAAGGVSGAFGSLVNANVPANFTSTLSYDANNAYLNLALNFVPNPGPNFGSGLSVNQQNVANTLVNFFNSTGGIPVAFGSLGPGGLAQASGELATRTQQTSFEAMNLFLGLLTDPFVAGRGDSAAPPAGAPQFAESDEANAYAANGKARSKSEREAYAAVYRKASIRDTYDPRWSVWAAGYGGSQTTDGNAALGSNYARSSIGGVAVGADYRFSPTTLAGFAVSGGGTGFSVANSGSGRSDLFQAGAFVRHTNGPAYISAALAYGWQDVTTDRTVTVAGSDLLRANFNANTFSSRAEGGYRFVAPWIGGVGVTPYAAGQFTTIDLPAYAEQAIAGANTFALTYASKSVTDTRSELGVRTDKSFAMQNGVLTLRGRAAWAHDFSPDRNIAATFQTLPGASFVVNGAAQASDAALVTGSAEMKWLNGFSMAATFEGEFSGITRSYAGKGVVRYAW